jgi:tryptophan halogenase
MPDAIQKVIVLGGGSAGLMAALALKTRIPRLDVRVIRSKDIGVIGVGEGSTPTLTSFLHGYLRVGLRRFFEVAQPTWKLGLKFLWGPRPHFYYPFGPGLDTKLNSLPKAVGFYCRDSVEDATPIMAMMARNKVFPRTPAGGPQMHPTVAYHFENDKFVAFLEGAAAALGITLADETVVEATTGPGGVASLRLASGAEETADLYVDCSGFASTLLGKATGEPFVDFGTSLFCDRAVVGGWARDAGDPVRPYTTCETMDAGWCWQIEHERRVNRGYVYCSGFISDEAAEREFRAKNPKVGPTREVRFTSGRYRDRWVGNVVAVGNASGFVEPLEATALGVIASQAEALADTLWASGCRPTPSQRRLINAAHARHWDTIRGFIALHYKFNTRPDTPFWRHCRADTDLAAAAPVVEYFTENGPDNFWEPGLIDPFDEFKFRGYATLLVGQAVPHANAYEPPAAEREAWDGLCRQNGEAARRAMSVEESLASLRSPTWKWAS